METPNALASAFLQSTFSEGQSIAIKAEDIQQGGGIDFSKHYFEAKVGCSYLINFLPNIGGDPVVHRSLYKGLPDPERKGKTFHYVSSGNSKSCKALELFFELNAAKKEGDAIAEAKIKKYLGKTNQSCVKIQILQSPDPAEVGIIRMMTFANFGPNATVANLIDKKLNPTKAQIEQGFEKEDIFDIFGSSVLSLVCEEATYDGQKGRDFTKSDWAPKQRGAIGITSDNKTHAFSKADIVDGQIKPEVVPFFNAFAETAMSEDYSIHKYFAYKAVGDAKNDADDEEYLKKVNAKVDEIIPVIRLKTMAEIAAYGRGTDAPEGEGKKKDAAKDVMSDSIPAELQGSIMAAVETVTPTPTQSSTPASADDSEVADILNS